MHVVSLFDYTGIMVKPWAKAGFTCWCVDVQHPRVPRKTKGNIRRVHYDLSGVWLPPFPRGEIQIVFAFPPCDHLAVSGARWFKGKGLRALAQSVNLFATAAEFCEWSKAPYLIENPVSSISTYWRKPDASFHPYEYSGYSGKQDHYTKKTCLWTGNGFTVPRIKPGNFGKPDSTYIHHASPGKDRHNLRSATREGFAQAVYLFNKGNRK